MVLALQMGTASIRPTFNAQSTSRFTPLHFNLHLFRHEREKTTYPSVVTTPAPFHLHCPFHVGYSPSHSKFVPFPLFHDPSCSPIFTPSPTSSATYPRFVEQMCRACFSIQLTKSAPLPSCFVCVPVFRCTYEPPRGSSLPPGYIALSISVPPRTFVMRRQPYSQRWRTRTCTGTLTLTKPLFIDILDTVGRPMNLGTCPFVAEASTCGVYIRGTHLSIHHGDTSRPLV